MITTIIKAVFNQLEVTAGILEVKNLTLEELTQRMNDNTLTISQWTFITERMSKMQELQSSINFSTWMNDHTETKDTPDE